MNDKLDVMLNNFTEMIELLKSNKDDISELKKDNDILKQHNQILIKNGEIRSRKIKTLENKVDGIILDEASANRNGRKPVLTSEDIEYIKDLRIEGLSLRKIAEMIDVSHTTVANSLKSQSVNKESNFTDTDDKPVTRKRLGLDFDTSGLDLPKAITLTDKVVRTEEFEEIKDVDIGSDSWGL